MTLYLHKAAMKRAYLTECDGLKFVCQLVIVIDGLRSLHRMWLCAAHVITS